MRVDRYKDANIHTYKVGDDGYDIDYIALGKRGQKTFVRIYNKTKEVISQGYKQFFFHVWLFNGLINRYDLYCYELAFKEKSFDYLVIARLKWYVDFGADDGAKEKCRDIVEKFDITGVVGSDTIAFADSITPKLNTIINVEYQTLRKGTKSYELVPFKPEDYKGVNGRIYQYLDNHAIIVDYLTHNTFRLVSGDEKNKSRRPYCPFWEALRRTRLVDCVVNKHQLKLIRNYERRLNIDMVKKRAVNAAISLGFYTKGRNEDFSAVDIMDSFMCFNDNDLQRAMEYKRKRLAHLPGDFDSGYGGFSHADFSIVDNGGVIFDVSNIDDFFRMKREGDAADGYTEGV